MASTMLGSPIYMAPEILNGQIYSNKADIWSIGVLLAELATDRFFLTADSFKSALDEADAEFGHFSAIISQCCHSDPAQRLDIAALEAKVQEALFPPVPLTPKG